MIVKRVDMTEGYPTKHQVLVGRDADRAIAEGERQIREDAHLLAREVAERHGRGHDRESVLLLRAHVRAEPAQSGVRADRQARSHVGDDAGSDDR